MISFRAINDCPYVLADVVGFIPLFLSAQDERSAKDQIDAGYAHGGGWHAYKGFDLDPVTMALKHEGDPSLLPWAMGKLRDEEIYVYPHAWVLIMQMDGQWEVARID